MNKPKLSEMLSIVLFYGGAGISFTGIMVAIYDYSLPAFLFFLGVTSCAFAIALMLFGFYREERANELKKET